MKLCSRQIIFSTKQFLGQNWGVPLPPIPEKIRQAVFEPFLKTPFLTASLPIVKRKPPLPFHWLQNLASGSPSSSLFWVRSARRTSVLSPCLESNMDTGLGISIPSTLFNTTETCWPLWQPLAKSGRLARLVVKAAELSGWLPAALGRAVRSNGTEDGGR